MMSLHDLGTVRLYETGGIVEAFFPRGDTVTRGAVKALKGRWDPNRRSWRIDPRFARMDVEQIVDRITDQLFESTPAGWQKALPTLRNMTCTTKAYALNIGEGGVRIELPSDNKHNWTLKESVPGAEREGLAWLLPADICAEGTVKGVIKDVIEGDRKALGKAIDYMEGYQLTGDLDLVEGESEAIGLQRGRTVFADPSFVRKADAAIEAEPLKYYPFQVLEAEPGEEYMATRLAFLTGDAAYVMLRKFLAPSAVKRPLVLDVRHLNGKWARKRL